MGAQAGDAAASIKAGLRGSGGVQFSEAVWFVARDAHSVNPYSDF